MLFQQWWSIGTATWPKFDRTVKKSVNNRLAVLALNHLYWWCFAQIAPVILGFSSTGTAVNLYEQEADKQPILKSPFSMRSLNFSYILLIISRNDWILLKEAAARSTTSCCCWDAKSTKIGGRLEWGQQQKSNSRRIPTFLLQSNSFFDATLEKKIETLKTNKRKKKVGGELVDSKTDWQDSKIKQVDNK